MPFLEINPIKESIMGYQSAKDVLPSHLIKEIQRYVDGEYLYIPICKRKSWGSQNGARALYRQRDLEIYRAYQNGADLKSLSKKYCLSPKGIDKILTKQRKQNG